MKTFAVVKKQPKLTYNSVTHKYLKILWENPLKEVKTRTPH